MNKKYFKTFFEEKDSILDMFEIVDKKGETHFFDKENVLNQLLSFDKITQKEIREKFIHIDFLNGDINQFIKYILQGLVN